MKTLLTIIILMLLNKSGFALENKTIDHNSVSLFYKIPQEFISASIQKRVMFRHASVGTTVDGGLNCLQGTKTKCNTYPQYKFDRRNWSFQIRGNSGWFGKINDFVNQVDSNVNSFDIFSFKYCYLDGLDEVDEPCGRFPSNPDKVKKAWDSLKNNMNRLEQKYPGKTFVWWTVPLTQIGENCTDEMNKLIRNYCRDNNKFLFDIADIECHDTLGNFVSNSNGLETAFKPFCGEQKPDAQACHPNDFGSVIIAKAFWVLIAKISGWNTDINSVTDEPQFMDNSRINLKTTCDFIEITGLTGSTNMDNKLQICNTLGEILINSNIQGGAPVRFDINNYPAGLYFCLISNNNVQRIIGFIKN